MLKEKFDFNLYDDYTPDNVSGHYVSGGTVFAVMIIIAFIAMAIFTAIQGRVKYPIHVHDRETISTVSRPAVKTYVRDEKNYFYPGDILSSKENGALILWDSLSMDSTLIIGIVSDSGTIKPLKK